MACISTPYFSLQINGGTEGLFPRKRGLRQGDPLSPYLFVICMEMLSRLLRSLPRHEGVSYHPKCVQLNLTHLIFADDLLVFTRGDLPSVKAVADCLALFDDLSGLQANPAKTSLYFGGVNQNVKKLILESTGLLRGSSYSDTWGSLFLMQGKSNLINSVIFGLNNFWGASVLLPKGIIKKLDKLCKDFLWGIEDGHRRHVFMSWKAICQPRREGGIGIKEILGWNCAQMMKWILKLMYTPECLWSKWVHKYILKGEDFWHAQTSISHFWYWNNVDKIKNFLVSRAGSPEQGVAWIHCCSANGAFSTNRMYHFLRDDATNVPWYNTVYDRACVPRHSFMAVLSILHKLPTTEQLVARGICIPNRCVLCERQSEDVGHLFFTCYFSSIVWQHVADWLALDYFSLDLAQVMNYYCTHVRGGHPLHGWLRGGLLATIYYIRWERNNRIFRGIAVSSESICAKIRFVVRAQVKIEPDRKSFEVVNEEEEEKQADQISEEKMESFNEIQEEEEIHLVEPIIDDKQQEELMECKLNLRTDPIRDEQADIFDGIHEGRAC
ncbi:uncharacterized protein LOC141607562 [Silene latifolia]|uniref:uncharacterized protein LOC141607562 n=1 Tax=Silene latifolia TaxID=37657 RepID=UPI003D775B36